MWSFTERRHKICAYCLIVIAMTVTIIVLLSVDKSEKLCSPPGIKETKRSSENVTLRIVGGEKAQPGEYPYLVSLNHEGQHYCGGGLISKRHVLTAAHCIDYFLKKKLDIMVVAGTHHLKDPDYGEYYEVEEMIPHPSYSHEVLSPDVGVIRLTKEVNMSAFVSVIELPKSGQRYLYHGRELDISGFGATRTFGPASDYLKKLTTHVCSRQICEYYFGDVRRKGWFCAFLADRTGVCFGDSGSPITIDKSVVIGVVTGGSLYGCGKGRPDVYTYVPDFLDFINDQMKK